MFKEELLDRLRHVTELVARSEKEEDVYFCMRDLLQLPWDREFAWHLERLLEESARIRAVERKLDALMDRPQLHCRFSGPRGDDILQLMTNVGPVERTKAIRHLQTGFSGAKHMTVCDPYFLRGLRGSTAQEYTEDFARTIPVTTQSLEIFLKPRERDPEVAAGINRLSQERNIAVRIHRTKELHDRVWIADGQRAFVVGASFNGLGNKCAFILELPPEDRAHFIAELANVRTRATSSVEA